MDKKKLVITIVCGVIALALVCMVLVGLISGQWPWQNNDWAADYTGMPSHGETNATDATDDGTTPDGTTGTGDATVGVDGPIIGVEIEDPNTGGSGSGGSGNGGSGNGGNSGGNKTEIDFDDLLGKDDDNKKPTTGGNSGSTTKPAEPETTEPEGTTPETTTPSTTAPDSDDDEIGGEKPEDTDIDVPIG